MNCVICGKDIESSFSDDLDFVICKDCCKKIIELENENNKL